jgi:hypothetical protein
MDDDAADVADEVVVALRWCSPTPQPGCCCPRWPATSTPSTRFGWPLRSPTIPGRRSLLIELQTDLEAMFNPEWLGIDPTCGLCDQC